MATTKSRENREEPHLRASRQKTQIVGLYLRASVTLFVLAAALLPGRSLRAAQDALKPFKLNGPRVLLPASVQATHQRGPDFDTFRFTVSAGKAGGKVSPKRRQILFAYVGFAPSFPGTPSRSGSEKQVTINGRPARNIQGKDKQGGQFREVLWQTGRRDFAGYVHFIYSGLTDAEAQRADSIIASVRPS